MTGTSNARVIFGKNWTERHPTFTILFSFRSVKLSFTTMILSATSLIMYMDVYNHTEHVLVPSFITW